MLILNSFEASIIVQALTSFQADFETDLHGFPIGADKQDVDVMCSTTEIVVCIEELKNKITEKYDLKNQ